MTDSDLKPDEQEEAQSPSLLPVGILIARKSALK